MRLGGFRFRLFLLVLVALVPGLGLILHDGVVQRRRADEGARAQVAALAALVAEHEQRDLDIGRGVLVGLAAMRRTTSASAECDEAVRRLMPHFPGVANLGAATPDGRVFCSAVPHHAPVSVADRAYFQRALARPGLVSGGFIASRIMNGRPVVNVALRAEDEAGVVRAVVFAGLDLGGLQQHLADLRLPLHATAMVTDRDGVVLARWPAAEGAVGKPAGGLLGAILARKRDAVAEVAEANGGRRLFAVRGVPADADEPHFLVVAGVEPEAARAPATMLLHRTLAAYAIASLLALLATYVVAEVSLARPIDRVVRAARRLAEGDASARTGVDAHGEIGQLARAFDEMAAKLAEHRRLEEGLRHVQKMEAVGQLAGGVAHDFNNLLTVILSLGRCVRDELPEGHPSRQDVDEILTSAERAAALTRQLLAFSRRQVVEPRIVDASEAVRDAEGLLRRVVGEHIQLLVDAPAPCLVRADPGQLAQILLNLAANARDAMPAGGRIDVAVRALPAGDPALDAGGPLPAGPLAAISVTDTGVGMDAETAARVFEPFFTTKPEGKGTGLGLASVYGIATASGGAARVRSAPGRGSTFTVYLPCASEAEEGDAAPGPRDGGAAVAPVARPGESILLVEDDEAVRALVLRVLRQAGYLVTAATGAADAATVSWEAESLDLLLTDVVLPDESGPALAARLRRYRPTLRVLYVSGYTAGHLAESHLVDGAALLSKPFAPDALLRAVREALDAPAPRERSDAA